MKKILALIMLGMLILGTLTAMADKQLPRRISPYRLLPKAHNRKS